MFVCATSTRPLRGFAVVALDDTAELLFAPDGALELWLERFVEHIVRHAHAPVRA